MVVEVPASFRAVSVVDDQVVWVSGSKGHVCKSIDGGKTWTVNQVKGFEPLDFRSCYAFDANSAIIANAGEPAHILKQQMEERTGKSFLKMKARKRSLME